MQMMILYSPLTTVFWNHPDDKSITSEAKCHFKIFFKSFQHISSERWVDVFFFPWPGGIKTTATRKWLGPVESFVRPSISTAQYNIQGCCCCCIYGSILWHLLQSERRGPAAQEIYFSPIVPYINSYMGHWGPTGSFVASTEKRRRRRGYQKLIEQFSDWITRARL